MRLRLSGALTVQTAPSRHGGGLVEEHDRGLGRETHRLNDRFQGAGQGQASPRRQLIDRGDQPHVGGQRRTVERSPAGRRHGQNQPTPINRGPRPDNQSPDHEALHHDGDRALVRERMRGELVERLRRSVVQHTEHEQLRAGDADRTLGGACRDAQRAHDAAQRVERAGTVAVSGWTEHGGDCLR